MLSWHHFACECPDEGLKPVILICINSCRSFIPNFLGLSHTNKPHTAMLDHPKPPKPSIRLCFSRVLIRELQFDFQGRVSMKTCIFQSLLNPSATQNSHNACRTQAHQCLLCFHRLIKNIHCSPWGVSPSCKTRDCSTHLPLAHFHGKMRLEEEQEHLSPLQAKLGCKG